MKTMKTKDDGKSDRNYYYDARCVERKPNGPTGPIGNGFTKIVVKSAKKPPNPYFRPNNYTYYSVYEKK